MAEDSSKHEMDHITLTHFILEEQKHHPEASGQLTILLHAIEIASKFISSKVRAAGLFRLYGAEGTENATGDQVKKLDVVANNAFKTSLIRSSKSSYIIFLITSEIVGVMVSEEDKDPVIVKDSKGHYMAVFDPLDGSSNIDANVSIGSIFGIYKRANADSEPKVEEVLQPGNKLVAAGYTMYGSATMMVLSTGHGVNGFTLDPSTGEFVLTHPSIKIPKKHNIYSINEGYYKYWFDSVRKYVDKLKDPKDSKSIYSQRYVGSMVADVHRTLLYGGIFMYPGDTRSPEGKLRLLYEANPMAFLMEQAGGKAITGNGRILDVQPKGIHERVPVFLGSKENVEEIETFFNAEKKLH